MYKSSVINPQGTAQWLVDNTALSFDQIAQSCNLHIMEVQSIADGEKNFVPYNPVLNGIISQEEIEACTQDHNCSLILTKGSVAALKPKRKSAKYKPLALRRVIPEAVLWFILFHPYVPDSEIAKLTDSTIVSVSKIRSGEYRNIASLTPKDPTLVRLCSIKDLDTAIAKYKPHNI